MSIRISQSEDRATGSITLQVEGSLTADAAELLNDICAGLIKQSPANIIINVAQVRFLDSDGAAALRCLKKQGIRFEGCELFTQRVVESAELH